MNMYSPQPQTHDMRTNVQWASGVNVIAGAWLFISAWILGFGDRSDAVWNNVIVGVVVVVMALISASASALAGRVDG